MLYFFAKVTKSKKKTNKCQKKLRNVHLYKREFMTPIYAEIIIYHTIKCLHLKYEEHISWDA